MKRFLTLLLAAGLMFGCAPPGGDVSPPREGLSTPESPSDSAQPDTSPLPPTVYLDSIYYEKTSFYTGIGNAGDYSVEGDLVAGMIPHHLVASDMIAGFFAMAAQQPAYDGILIVSPSHFPENCGSMVVTARAGWNTPLGTVAPYTQLIDRLLGDSVLEAENNPAAVEFDHGAAGLVPFVKHYFPDTPLAVCLVQGKTSRDRLTALWEVIATQREEARLLVISSADCSHYLMPQEAARHDEQTMEAIEGGQTERIFLFDDENVDSPQSVNTFLTVAQQAGAQVVRLDHSSSNKKLPHAIDSPIYREGVTSYLVYGGVTTEQEH